MKRIFLSADDFGRSPERNRAIDEAFKRGLIKSAGLIVTGKHLQDAVNLMNSGGYVSHVHCHFNLSGNIKNEDSQDIPLTEEMRKDSLFCKDGRFLSYVQIPKSPWTIFHFVAVYKELVAQYKKFIVVTDGKGNKHHIDFHLWYNLTWSVAVALNIFTWTHKIKSVRYIGVHHEHKSRRYRFIKRLSRNPFVSSCRSSNIDGYLTKPEWFKNDNSFELYCHPDYVEGRLMDNSISYFGNEQQLLETNIKQLQEKNGLEFVSWSQED